jgi:3',5'-cyclic AMP phosphodiesterase CpdA
MLNFLHLSDIHIPDKRGDLWYGVNPFDKLDKLIKNIIKLELNPSYTIITGDISHTGTPLSYNNVKQYFKKITELGGPVYPTMGTHDNRKNFKQILLEETPKKQEPQCYYSKTIKGIHIIAMDSHTPNSVTGSFSPEQLEWLENELIENIDIPSVIAFHEPIFFYGELGLFKKEDAQRFREIISSGNVLAVLNGHMHTPMFTFVDGVYYVQAGSPLWVNYYSYSGDEVTYDSSSFNLLTYSEEYPSRLLVRPVYFSEGQKLVNKTT